MSVEPLYRIKALPTKGLGRGVEARLARAEARALNAFIKAYNDTLKERDGCVGARRAPARRILDAQCHRLHEALRTAAFELAAGLLESYGRAGRQRSRTRPL